MKLSDVSCLTRPCLRPSSTAQLTLLGKVPQWNEVPPTSSRTVVVEWQLYLCERSYERKSLGATALVKADERSLEKVVVTLRSPTSPTRLTDMEPWLPLVITGVAPSPTLTALTTPPSQAARAALRAAPPVFHTPTPG